MEQQEKKSEDSLWKWLKTDDGKFFSDLILKFAKVVAPSAWIAFWELIMICAFLIVIMVCASHGWIESRTTETLLVLIIGTIIGSKFKNK